MEEATSTQEVETKDSIVSDGSGAPDDSKPDPKPEKSDSELALSRYKSDMLKYKDKVRELESKMEVERVNKLKEQERFQELAEDYRGKYESEAEKNKKLNEAVVYDRKYSAVKEAALQAGIKKEALSDLELVSLDDVEIETTSTGRVNILNADKAVERLKMTRPHWFGKKGVNININDPEVTAGSKITYEDLEKARKSGDTAKYAALHKKYRMQQ